MGSHLFSILYGGSSCSNLPTTSLQRCPCMETDSGRMRCAPCTVSYTLAPKEASWLICRHYTMAIMICLPAAMQESRRQPDL